MTGGGRGIGAATSRLLAEQGWDVCIGYLSDETSAASVRDACLAMGRAAVIQRVDVSSEADIVALFAAVDAQLGPLGALVNNAGIVAAKARVDEMTWERVRGIMEVNVVGAMIVAREAVRRMSTSHGGAGGAS